MTWRRWFERKSCNYENRVQIPTGSNHNLCFRAKIRKPGKPLNTQDLLYKSGVQGGLIFIEMFSSCRPR